MSASVENNDFDKLSEPQGQQHAPTQSDYAVPKQSNPAETAADANAEAQGTGSSAAPAEQEKKPLTRREWGKIMRLYFTRVNPAVTGCGHKLDSKNPPRQNCDICWFAFFQSNGELVKSLDEAHRSSEGDESGEGLQAIVAIYGTKFLCNFRKFMSTLAQWKAQAEAAAKAEAEKPCPKQGHTGYAQKCKQCLAEGQAKIEETINGTESIGSVEGSSGAADSASAGGSTVTAEAAV